MRELYPVQGGATEGFEFKWVQNGQTYRVRVHNVDPSAPVGSNAYNGWVVMPIYMAPWIFPLMFVLSFTGYLVISLLQMKRIKKIPMDEALKNVE